MGEKCPLADIPGTCGLETAKGRRLRQRAPNASSDAICARTWQPNIPYSPGESAQSVRAKQTRDAVKNLTAQGLSIKQISKRLNCSTSTVNLYRRS